MSDSSTVTKMSEPPSIQAILDAGEAVDGPRLRLAGTSAGPLTPTIQRLLEFRNELLSAKAVILEDAGFIRRRLERSGRRDAITCITGEDAFDGVATRIDHEISRVDLELARLDEKAVSIETEPVSLGRLRRDS